MTFGESISTCFQKYVKFEGRASRSEYWWFWLFSFLVGFVCGLINANLSSVATLALLLPSLAVGVRRMHDIGKSGWYILVPILNIVYFCTEGENGANEYGDMPY